MVLLHGIYHLQGQDVDIPAAPHPPTPLEQCMVYHLPGQTTRNCLVYIICRDRPLEMLWKTPPTPRMVLLSLKRVSTYTVLRIAPPPLVQTLPRYTTPPPGTSLYQSVLMLEMGEE